MGLDLSTTSTGVCVKENGQVKYLAAITPDTSLDHIDRAIYISSVIDQLIDNYSVQKVFIENYSYGSKIGREVLAELHGIVMYNLKRKNVPFMKISPTQIKMFGCGRGQAPPCPPGRAKSTWAKTWVVEEVNKRYNQEFRFVDHDKVDAFIVASLGEALMKIENGELDINQLPDYQAKAIKHILKTKK